MPATSLRPYAIFSVADAFFRHPEWQALYTDEARIDPQGMMSGPHFKPDFNLDLMRSLPYVGALLGRAARSVRGDRRL